MSVSTPHINVNESSEVRVHCQADQVGRPIIQWSLYGPGNELPVGVTQNGTDLYIGSATRAHTGVYECKVSDIADIVNITVNCKSIAFVNRYIHHTFKVDLKLFHATDLL